MDIDCVTGQKYSKIGGIFVYTKVIFKNRADGIVYNIQYIWMKIIGYRQKAANWCLSLCSKFPVIARPVRTLVVAIPLLEGKCIEKYPEEWASPRFLVVIATWFLSTGGLPHQCAHWFAMTGNLQRALSNNNLFSLLKPIV